MNNEKFSIFFLLVAAYPVGNQAWSIKLSYIKLAHPLILIEVHVNSKQFIYIVLNQTVMCIVYFLTISNIIITTITILILLLIHQKQYRSKTLYCLFMYMYIYVYSFLRKQAVDLVQLVHLNLCLTSMSLYYHISINFKWKKFNRSLLSSNFIQYGH